MITSIERIGSDENHDGWFLINKQLQVKYTQDKEGKIVSELNFEPDVLTDQEAHELAEELLQESIQHRKKFYAN